MKKIDKYVALLSSRIPTDSFAIAEKQFYKKLYRNGCIFAMGVSRSPAIGQAV